MIYALILAAGESSRMGVPKPLLDFRGIPCLELVREVCNEAGLDRHVIVLGHKARVVREGVSLDGARVITNPSWRAGMICSIQIGLSRIPGDADAFLLFPVDYPLVLAETVRTLVTRRERSNGARIYLPTHEGRRGHPVLFDADFIADFLHLQNGMTARDLIHDHGNDIEEVATNDHAVLREMNTPEEYQAALLSYRQRF